MNVNIKPKIKQSEPSPGSPARCADCGTTTAEHMVETYVVATEEGNGYPTATKKDLCGSCLVGHDVAVSRRNESNDWCFGEVKEYDAIKLHPFLMSFLDGNEEWADVSRKPTTDYLNFLGLNQPQARSSPPDILGNKRIGSFSSTSFSTLSSTNVGDTFPLFEDSKIVHLDHHSFSTFDEHMFSESDDDEGNIEVQLKKKSTQTFTPKNSETSPSGSVDEKGNIEVKLNKNRSSSSDSNYEDGNIEVQLKKMIIKPYTLKTSQSKTVFTPKKQKKKPKTRSPVMWTPEEDAQLQKVTDSFIKRGKALKWPEVAELVPSRNGKQCRERYINHLSSDLRSDEWSPEEDATLFSLFYRFGKKWCQIAKMLPGRTDNGTKNRFHHLRRRLDKDQSKIQQYSSILPQMEDGEESATFEQKIRKILKILSVETEATPGLAPNRMGIKGYVFGPFVLVDKATMCKRCGLFVPSMHTGQSMCTKSQWCEACTMVPPYVQHDLLRECLGMRDPHSSGEGKGDVEDQQVHQEEL